MKNPALLFYAAYFPLAILLVVGVTQSFFKNSKIFMLDIFKNREDIAKSTNQLMKTGFLLICLGFAFVTSYFYISVNEMEPGRRIVETLSTKLGSLSIALGIMVCLFLYILFRGKKKSRANALDQARMQKFLDNKTV
ncbi:MAG: formate/nitrite transporter FocA (FNT family) [Bacteroidia bacterium]|jgi:formate/nitrite transporter FocA (FNT family)